MFGGGGGGGVSGGGAGILPLWTHWCAEVRSGCSTPQAELLAFLGSPVNLLRVAVGTAALVSVALAGRAELARRRTTRLLRAADRRGKQARRARRLRPPAWELVTAARTGRYEASSGHAAPTLPDLRAGALLLAS